MSHKPLHAGDTNVLQSLFGRVMPGAIIDRQVKVTDISFWQDDNATSRKVDFLKMKAAGTRGVFLRAGQNTWKDPDFDDYARDARIASIARGAYWFYDSRSSPTIQANLFWSYVSKMGLEMEYVVDYEENYKGPFGGTAYLRQFIERLMVLGAPKNKIMIYTGYYYWNSHSGGDRSWFGQFPLWLAWYTTNPAYVLIPSPWSKITFWQWTSNGDGPAHGVESKSIDLNWFNGSPSEFDARYGLAEPPPPPPPPPDRVKLLDIDVYSNGDVTVNGEPLAK